MKVTVKYSAQLKQAAGVSREILDVANGCSARHAVLKLAVGKTEPLKGMLLDSTGAPHEYILLCVNDEQIAWDSELKLNDDDEIILLSPISGG
ncbi:MAG: MoaD/ThiS family protein [Planctomycetota bacterium]